MKLFLSSILLFFISFSALSQTKLGVKGGVNLTIFNVDENQFGETPDSELGYFGGVFANFFINEKFRIQPELIYKGVGDFEFLNAPIFAEYYVSEEISLLLGPSLNYFFDLFTNSFKVRGDVSLAYHLSDVVEINLKYMQGFDELSPNIIFFGAGFSL